MVLGMALEKMRSWDDVIAPACIVFFIISKKIVKFALKFEFNSQIIFNLFMWLTTVSRKKHGRKN